MDQLLRRKWRSAEGPAWWCLFVELTKLLHNPQGPLCFTQCWQPIALLPASWSCTDACSAQSKAFASVMGAEGQHASGGLCKESMLSQYRKQTVNTASCKRPHSQLSLQTHFDTLEMPILSCKVEAGRPNQLVPLAQSFPARADCGWL